MAMFDNKDHIGHIGPILAIRPQSGLNLGLCLARYKAPGALNPIITGLRLVLKEVTRRVTSVFRPRIPDSINRIPDSVNHIP